MKTEIMDDTTTSPTTATAATSASAAAAVADTAAATKLKTTSAVVIPNNNNVRIVIKSSNQQYDDMIVDGDLCWTVHRLKKHLAHVYPGKPAIEDQKLIYSGKLLKDKQPLSEVIRSYKDVYTLNHIMHLVCANKNAIVNKSTATKVISPIPVTQASTVSVAAAATTSNSAEATIMDGLRQRTNIGTERAQQQQQQQDQQHQQQQPPLTTEQQLLLENQRYREALSQLQARIFNMWNQDVGGTFAETAATATNNATATPTIPGYAQQVQAIVQQQAFIHQLWMQQIYARYMEQIIQTPIAAPAVNNVTPNNNNSFSQSMTLAAATAGNINAAQRMPGMLPLNQVFNANYNVPSSTVNVVNNAPTMASSVQTGNGSQLTNATDDAVAPTGVAAARVAPAPAPAPAPPAEQGAQRRFHNIQEEPEHNDWLDNFFAIIRLSIFATILYFNSSPLRCFFVLLIASSIYLYHIGIFRRAQERNNNNINRNNNADPAENAQAADPPRLQVQAVAAPQEQAAAAPQMQGAAAPQVQAAVAPQVQAAVAPQVQAATAPPVQAAAASQVQAVAAQQVQVRAQVALDTEQQSNVQVDDNVNTAILSEAGAANINVNANTNVAEGIATTAATPINAPVHSASVISVVRTFVVTFFTSLLPEAPPL